MSELESWIIAQGLNGTSVSVLLDGIAERLAVDGVPLLRAYLALPTVNPTVRVVTHTWRRGIGTIVDGLPHDGDPKAFESSPFSRMLNEGATARRWRLEEALSAEHPILEELRAQGATDYLARLIAFTDPETSALRGVGLSFATDRPDGFSDAQIARIDAVLPLLGLAAYRIALYDLTVGVLDTYVGLSAGRRVLSGEMRRGFGSRLTAALVFADLRGFTVLADTDGASLITRLDEHLEAMAEPVVERGGEVLKFLGDGLLAVFPINETITPDAASAAAVDAALDALRRNEIVNRHRAGETPLALDIALHLGDVFYGNIGAAQRLDFTVIGPAVNEVSRMETLCAPLGCPILLSAPVAKACGRPVRSLGFRHLRGVSEERELFTLAEPFSP